MLGIWEAFKPRFVKRYAHMAEDMVKAFQDYIKEVKEGKFPEDVHCYKMIEGESGKLVELVKQK